MLEVVFGNSAAGSLKAAMGSRPRRGKTVVAPAIQENSCEPTKADLEQWQKNAAEEQRRNESDMLNGSREDIMVFPLALSLGEIDEDGIGEKRKRALKRLAIPDPRFPEDPAKEAWEKGRSSLDAVRKRAVKGEPIRIWASSNPDEMCGLYWLMKQLQPIGFENLNVTLVKLPDFEERPDGVVVQYSGWGEMDPDQWGKMAAMGRKLPVNYIRGLAGAWEKLQRENAPLRAVLNGKLVSMPENLYDSFILQELDCQEDEFPEACVIGAVLGKYQLGIGDGWLAMRIERMIHNGLLKVMTPAGEDDLSDRRILRKCDSLRKSRDL